MRFEIKHRLTGAVLFSLKTESMKLCVEEAVSSKANLRGADLRGANLVGANLVGANLVGANLVGANLVGANLVGANLGDANLMGADIVGANLVGANLGGANLGGANLGGAKGINKYLCTPLLMLLDQPGKIRAYKLVKSNGEGPYNGGIIYEVGKSYSVDNADCTDDQCAAGINLATLDWCMRYWQSGYRILVAEFEASDIASIPVATDGKFRVHRCTIVGEKDLKEIGLIEEKEARDA